MKIILIHINKTSTADKTHFGLLPVKTDLTFRPIFHWNKSTGLGLNESYRMKIPGISVINWIFVFCRKRIITSSFSEFVKFHSKLTIIATSFISINITFLNNMHVYPSKLGAFCFSNVQRRATLFLVSLCS